MGLIPLPLNQLDRCGFVHLQLILCIINPCSSIFLCSCSKKRQYLCVLIAENVSSNEKKSLHVLHIKSWTCNLVQTSKLMTNRCFWKSSYSITPISAFVISSAKGAWSFSAFLCWNFPSKTIAHIKKRRSNKSMTEQLGSRPRNVF